MFRRFLYVFLFTAFYIALGFMLKLDANQYLLAGIPMTVVFQLLVSKQPLHKLWVRDNETFRLNKLSILLSVVFAVYPCTKIIQMVIRGKWDVTIMGYYAAAVFGALGAGYAFANFSKKTMKDFFLCLLTAGGIGIGFMVAAAIAQSMAKHMPFHFDLGIAAKSLALYIPVTFVMEEVVFRGLLYAYLEPAGQKGKILSAVFVSALWGWWHLPIVPVENLTTEIIALPILQCLVGVPLSIFWSRSGNLAVPGFTHAFIDAVRNGLMR
jgi:membrane protease YdiL (CAAX protease family)